LKNSCLLIMEHSNSKNGHFGGILRGLLRDRTAKALLLAVVLCIVTGSLRPNKPEGMSATAYWAKKTQWKHCADAVLTGDSRVLMGLSPDIIEQYVDYKEIVNYGFAANLYNEEYMQATEELLNPNAAKTAIIMGFSPHALAWRSRGKTPFAELSSRSRINKFLEIHAGWLFDLFEPMSPRDTFHGLFPDTAPIKSVKNFKESGWVAVHKAHSNVDRQVKRYLGAYKDRQVSDKTVDVVMEYISRWSDAGINVYGFVPPSCEDMVELEKRVSGFDEESFVAKFKEAGGIWLEADLTAYNSFDGSHLQDDGAVEFSHDLARMIQEAENGRDKIACTD